MKQPCLRSLREEEKRPKKVWALSPNFYAVMSGRRKTSPPCFKSLREEEEGPKTVWALSPNKCDEVGRRKLHREVFMASGRRRKP
ncbi:hypothetical protein [Pacificibacter marinus]|uniref:hypothetical protein n=1 Tax=Pacificibacter marinus TaxID=658057 RepID=UPI001C0680CC|nr:hypothetical protein [Pacificibacter marinus]MBU2866941.1 hypothetical protein [Pacificibacter marinus]